MADGVVSIFPSMPEPQYAPLDLVQAYCSNLARKSMGSSFKTSERKAMASSKSAHDGSVVLRMWVQVKMPMHIFPFSWNPSVPEDHKYILSAQLLRDSAWRSLLP